MQAQKIALVRFTQRAVRCERSSASDTQLRFNDLAPPSRSGGCRTGVAFELESQSRPRFSGEFETRGWRHKIDIFSEREHLKHAAEHFRMKQHL
jgi:hypothetical protein